MTRYGASWLIILIGAGLWSSVGLAQSPPDQTLTLEMLQRIEQLEKEVRHIRGELEIQRHQLEDLQSGPTVSSPAYPPAAATPSLPAAALPSPPTASSERTPLTSTPLSTTDGTEKADFDAALTEWREGRYVEAISAWRHFLSSYPNSKLAGDAQYWLGEAYYISRDYNAAKEAFINLGLHDSQSARLPDALLKLGYIYGELGDAERAREVLQKLVQVYPNTQAASLAERRLQSLR